MATALDTLALRREQLRGLLIRLTFARSAAGREQLVEQLRAATAEVRQLRERRLEEQAQALSPPQPNRVS